MQISDCSVIHSIYDDESSTKRRHSSIDDSNRSHHNNDGTTNKKSKSFDSFAELIKWVECHSKQGNFKILRIAENIVKFMVLGTCDGTKIFVEINEIKFMVQVIFMYYRECVKIERAQSYETIVPNLEHFLVHAKKVNTKVQLIVGLNWDNYRIEGN